MHIIAFIIILALLILVHEMGHFITAKYHGIRVFEFGIGFPPRLFSVVRAHTRYSLNLIPLGGFVRMKEYIDEDGIPKGESFQEKNFFSRLLVVLSGALMNVVFAVVLFVIGYNIGFPQMFDTIPEYATVSQKKIYVASVLQNSPAERAGIHIGDELIVLNGQPIDDINVFIQTIQKIGTQPVEIIKRENNQDIHLTLTPTQIEEIGTTGVGIGLVQSGLITYPFGWSIIEGIKTTANVLKEITGSLVMLIARLIRQQPIEMEIAGPIGIASLTGDVAKLGFVYLVQFAAILSLNLAVLNVFPFPALDGGRVFLLIIEKIRRKPLTLRLETAIQNIGFVVLIALVIMVTIKDLSRLDIFYCFF